MSIARRGGLAVVVVAALTVLLILTAATASAQVTWKLASAYPADNFHTQNLAAFANDVAQVTDGRLAIRIYPNASLFPASAIKSAVRVGQAPIGETLIRYRRSGALDLRSARSPDHDPSVDAGAQRADIFDVVDHL